MSVVLATGGSGGHIIPAVKVAESLTRKGTDPVLVGSFERFPQLLQDKPFAIRVLPARGLQKFSWKTCPGTALFMIKSTFAAIRLLQELRPQAVMGFGGYGAFPVVLAAVFLRIPRIIHEQNVRLGKANRCLMGMVSCLALSFSETEAQVRGTQTVVTGCPGCRPQQEAPQRQDLCSRLGLNPGQPTVLVMGGSQGSHKINEVFVSCWPRLRERKKFQALHVTGERDFPAVLQQTQGFGPDYKVWPFYDDMSSLYSVADIAVSRAGAVSVTELLNFGIPAVLIPYPYAGAHQDDNALALISRGPGRKIAEQALTADRLVLDLLALYESQGRRPPAVPFPDDPAERLADLALKY